MATNQITITFTTCTPTPIEGYLIFYRPIGGIGTYRVAGPFSSSPAVFTDELDGDGQEYEGYIISHCGGGVFGNDIPFDTIVGPLIGSEGESDSAPPPDEFFSFTPLTEDYSRPFAGSFRWNEQSGAQIVGGVQEPLNYYRRFDPMDFGNSASGVYNWTKFDDRVKEAINAGQTFSFGVMTLYPDPDFGGFNIINENYVGFDDNTSASNTGHSVLPSWVLNTVQKWVGPSGDWNVYYSDPVYAAYLNELYGDITAHINSTSYVAASGPHAGQTVQFADVIEFVDVRGVGSYGEWHHANFLNPGQTIDDDFPAGAFGSASDFNAIIDAHVNQFTDWPLVIIFNSFDHEMLPHTRIPNAVGVHAMTVQNDWGPLGYRNDHFADWFPSSSGYYDNQYQQLHPEEFSPGVDMSDVIMARYLLSPIIGEFPGGPSDGECGSPFCEAPDEAAFYHYAMEGNGNFGGSPGANAAVQEGFAVSGHIVRPTGGGFSLTDTNFYITIDWANYGSAPSYDKSFVTTFELRSGASVVWTAPSDFNVFRFFGTHTEIDAYARPALGAGTYELFITFPDSRGGYRAPFPLGIEGRVDGAYKLADVVFDALP